MICYTHFRVFFARWKQDKRKTSTCCTYRPFVFNYPIPQWNMLTSLKIPRDLNSKQLLMCHWRSSLWVKVKIHNCFDGANDGLGYFCLNFLKWNAFKFTSAMSSSICPGLNVLWWHRALDTPSTVRRIDVNSLTDSVTDVSALIR